MISFEHARNALYLDFEATAKPTAPALLGVLTGAQFTQYVIDPALDDAARAADECHAAELPALLEQLASQMTETDAGWCSWSTFDLEIIRQSGASGKVVEVFERKHRNALDVVPRWAANYGVRPPRARFEARNQLHRFFEVAGYRPDWRYGRAEPAKWIRDTRKRMAAGRGRYAALSKTGRCDWHALLAYNRHDCVGLRHLVLRATAETEKRGAYLNTQYSVHAGRRPIQFRIGSNSSRLDALITSRQARHWAHMTAWNPGLARLSADENTSKQEALVAEAQLRGYQVVPGEGVDIEGRWPAEPSALIIGIGKDEARELGRKYGQWAIVVGAVGARSQLQWCLDPGPDPLVVNQLQWAG
jgi:hypothetical protein